MPKLGINNGQLTECPGSPNCVSSQAKDEAHRIQPIAFSGNAIEGKTQLLKILKDSKRVKVVEEQANYIRAEFVSAIFRFVDDVEFYFPETIDSKTNIEVRSASRIGRSDFGANRKRIEAIRSLIK